MSGSFELVKGRRCFRPDVPALPRIDDVADMLIPAFAALSAFDARLTGIGEEGMIGRLFARLDAVHSSGAEGSTTTFTDLMEFEVAPEAAPDPDDAAVVAACADAFASALTGSQDPIAAARNIHRRLFERSSNRMISSGAGSLKTALNATSDLDEPGGQFFYTSPEATPTAMAEWSRLTTGGREDQRAVELVRQAASHWMFEHIHPFADGNGRVGRLMVPLCTRWNQGSTSACAFLGEPVHENKDIYIDALKHGRRTGDLTTWTRTFLSFIRQAAEANTGRLDRLEALQNDWRDRVDGVRTDSVAWRLLPWLLTHPAATVNQMREAMGVGFPAANAAAVQLVKAGVLDVAHGARRDRIFHATGVLAIFDRFLSPSDEPTPS